MKTFISWSGGKDSMLALYRARQQGIHVESLFVSINKAHDRVSMHGVRKTLLYQQASCLQLPMQTLELSEEPGMKEYEECLHTSYASYKKNGFGQAIFGDIFLEDLKVYREMQLAKQHLKAVFPLWSAGTKELLCEFISLGFKAIVVCVNTQLLDKSFCGRIIDESFMKDLPPCADPCGEYGEYHSFVFDGPLFTRPVQFNRGEIVYKEYKSLADPDEDSFTPPAPVTGFYFIDLLPVSLKKLTFAD